MKNEGLNLGANKEAPHMLSIQMGKCTRWGQPAANAISGGCYTTRWGVPRCEGFFFFTGFSWKVPWVAANLSCHCHRLRPKYPHQMKSIRCAHDCLVVLRPGSKQAQRRKSMWKVNILLMLWHIRESSSWILCTCPQTHRSQSTLKVQIQASTERRAFTPCRDPDVVNSEQLLYIFREAIKTEKTTCSALTHMTLSPFSTCQGQVPLISFQINQDDTLLLKDSC